MLSFLSLFLLSLLFVFSLHVFLFLRISPVLYIIFSSGTFLFILFTSLHVSECLPLHFFLKNCYDFTYIIPWCYSGVSTDYKFLITSILTSSHITATRHRKPFFELLFVSVAYSLPKSLFFHTPSFLPIDFALSIPLSSTSLSQLPFLPLSVSNSSPLPPSVLHFLVYFHHFGGANEARLD